jgi:hypothetical protein
MRDRYFSPDRSFVDTSILRLFNFLSYFIMFILFYSIMTQQKEFSKGCIEFTKNVDRWEVAFKSEGGEFLKVCFEIVDEGGACGIGKAKNATQENKVGLRLKLI